MTEKSLDQKLLQERKKTRRYRLNGFIESETRKHVKDPVYRVTILKDNIYKTWLFSHGEKDWALAFKKRFQRSKINVVLYERKWTELISGD